MNIYLGIKYKSDLSNKDLIEEIVNTLHEHHVFCVHKDLEEWGVKKIPLNSIMEETFLAINQSDIVLIEFSEKGVGLGIEAGYAKAIQKPVYVFHKKGTEVSPTLYGIADKVIEYKKIKPALIKNFSKK